MITTYTDAAFTNNADSSSQLGRIFHLNDDTHNSVSVSYKSYESGRVARSVLSATVIAFADLLDDALAIRKQLEFVLRQPIPEHIPMESKSMFDIISKENPTCDKRAMPDIYAVRQA